jgi:hypothetical protein
MRESTQAKIPSWFTTQVLGLAFIYPQAKIDERHVAAWWVHLGDLEPEHLAVGLQGAIHESPLFVPSAEQVRAKAVESRQATARRAAAARAEQEHESARERLLAEPSEYELPPEGPFRDLALRWQAESRELGIAPDQITPRHIAAKRMADLQALLAGHLL